MTAASVAHTPGTWHFNGRRITTGAVIIADVWNADEPTGQANARLIAAAPDLLAALKEAYEFTPAHGADCGGTLVVEEDAIFEEVIGCTCFLSEWKAAIFKAEGRSEP